MKKNKEWLKETLKKRMEYWELNVAGGDYGRGRSDETRELLKAIDQLDEPNEMELSEPSAWKTIAKLYHPNEVYWGNVRDSYVESLEEQDKVVIPQFVGDWLRCVKNTDITLYGAMDNEFLNTQELTRWMTDAKNQLKFARAWLDGYTVEKEKLYYVRENNYLLCKHKGEVIDYVEAIDRRITNLVELKLTEKEIKDYDERFWAFAEEITK